MIKLGARRASSTFLGCEAQERSWTGRRAPYKDIAGPARGRGHGGGQPVSRGGWGWLEPDAAGQAEGRAGPAVFGVSAPLSRLRSAPGSSLAGAGPGHDDGVVDRGGRAGVLPRAWGGDRARAVGPPRCPVHHRVRGHRGVADRPCPDVGGGGVPAHHVEIGA